MSPSERARILRERQDSSIHQENEEQIEPEKAVVS
jgi:hypothetical protein